MFGHAAICYAAVCNYMIMKRFPLTTAICLFFFYLKLRYVKLILHEHIHETSARAVTESHVKYWSLEKDVISLSVIYSLKTRTVQKHKTYYTTVA